MGKAKINCGWGRRTVKYIVWGRKEADNLYEVEGKREINCVG